MNSRQQDELIEQTESQRDPGKARPEDFQVSIENNAAVPGHVQRGDNAQEFNQLLAIRASKAGKSHSARLNCPLVERLATLGRGHPENSARYIRPPDVNPSHKDPRWATFKAFHI